MIILCILIIGVIIGIISGIIECIRNPAILRTTNATEPNEQNNDLINKLELVEVQIDTLHELVKSIDNQLDYTTNEKQRITLLNKKAVTIGKIERLQDKQNKIIDLLDGL